MAMVRAELETNALAPLQLSQNACAVAWMVSLPQLAFAQSVVVEDEPGDEVITCTDSADPW